MRTSIRKNGYCLAPFGIPTARFDLPAESVAYLADTPQTALYETSFRREARSCSWDRLQKRSLVAFETRAGLKLVVLRGHEEQYPVLQSERYESTQAFALECRLAGFHGILYASAQHPSHACVCLFEAGMALTTRVATVPLIKPGTDQLHWAVVDAARGSEVPIAK